MKERPILFSGPMVKAILEGRKTQTRRPIKFGNWANSPVVSMTEHNGFKDEPYSQSWTADHEAEKTILVEQGIKCPYGKKGDRLWVRHDWYEQFKGTYNHQAFNEYTHDVIWKSGEKVAHVKSLVLNPWKHKPSIHMPRWASRITLEITKVWVERVQDITEADAKTEGKMLADIIKWRPDEWQNETPLKARFAASWDLIYPSSWDRNDWVWVVEFKRV